MFRCIAVLWTVASLAVVAPAQAEVTADDLRDLTESGRSLAFRDVGPGRVAVETLEDPTIDRPAFDIRAEEGARVAIVFPGLPSGWSARIWSGPGEWRPLTIAESDAGLRLDLVFARDRELVELLPPGFVEAIASGYSIQDFVNYVTSLPPDPRLKWALVGSSVQGVPLLRLVFEDTSAPWSPVMKPTVILLFRQHGDEWPTGYVFEGMLDYLLGLNGWQPDWRETQRMRWVFYLIVNPDGMVLNQRYNAHGVDLNRDWGRLGPSPSQEPETFAIQGDLEGLPWQGETRVVSDQHSWWSSPDGGYRYDDGGAPATVPHPVYLESRKDTERITECHPRSGAGDAVGDREPYGRVHPGHPLYTTTGPPTPFDGILQSAAPSLLIGVYVDPDLVNDFSLAPAFVLSPSAAE